MMVEFYYHTRNQIYEQNIENYETKPIQLGGEHNLIMWGLTYTLLRNKVHTIVDTFRK